MARSSRSSARKNNNQRLAAKVFGPVESARAERLSARLLELAQQAKPAQADVNMDAQDETSDAEKKDKAPEEENIMEVDSKPSRASMGKKRIDKRKQKKSGIVFQKYSDRQKKKKSS